MSSINYLNQPYPDSQTMDSLTPLVRQWFTDRFKTFSPPQKFSILNIKKRKNTLISSPTGTGKTLSAFLAVLDDLILASQQSTLKKQVYCVYVSPLKALGNDVEQNLLRPLRELQELSEHRLGINVAVRTGDTTANEKRKMLQNPPHILITTPESLSILLASPKFSKSLQNVDYTIIDEIHSLADNKRGTQLMSSLERLASYANFTRVGLSATVAPLSEVAHFLSGYESEGIARACDIVDVNYLKQSDIKVLCPVKNMISTSHTQMRKKQYELLDALIQKHKTTLVFTNTRSATERVVHHLQHHFPKFYGPSDDASAKIRAHHGSLSKEIRLEVEDSLRQGSLRAVVCSTSLELGIDIGAVDLVVLLGSPKSVARGLQRIGRAGHNLDQISKGRIIVLDRDDLVECSVLAKAAIAGLVDKIDIPTNCLDVLAQEIYAMAIDKPQKLHEAFQVLRRSYPYRDLSWHDYMNTIRYLAGEYSSLEERHVYAKIWYDESTAEFGRRGRLARVIYMTNLGTIPDQTSVRVKIGEVTIGSISESFLEHLQKGDVFVLGGKTYRFRYSRGMTAQVGVAHGSRPTVPSWFSQMLPLSFDLSIEIQRFRRAMSERLQVGESKKSIINWLLHELPVDQNCASSLYEYFAQQHLYCEIPHDKKVLIEYFRDGQSKYVIVHTLFGRRSNDVLSRAVAFVAGRLGAGDADISISDNGFVLRYRKNMQAARALRVLQEADIDDVMTQVLERTQVLRRRFRHCAARALMILRNYKGRQKSVGRQQVSSKLLMSAIKRIDDSFPILMEARREVLHDAMDLDGAKKILSWMKNGQIKVVERHLDLPSPFAFKMVLQGYADVMKMEERQEFLRRLHQKVLAQIALKSGKKEVESLLRPEDFSYDSLWDEQDEIAVEQEKDFSMLLKEQLFFASSKEDIPPKFVYQTQKLIDGRKGKFSRDYINWLEQTLSGTIPKSFGDELAKFLIDNLPELSWS